MKIIFGQARTPIGIDEVLCKCAVCEKETWSDLMVESVYFHIYYVPVFPVDKLANLICEECGNKRYGLAFDSRLIPAYQEIKVKFRHPLKTYVLSALVGFIVLVSIITSIAKNSK